MIRSCTETASGNIEVLGYFDSDDPLIDKYKIIVGFIGDRRPLAPAYQYLFEHVMGDIIMLAADDIVFRTKGWDTKVKEAMPSDGIAVMSYDDLGRPKENGHPFIGRRFIEAMGYLCHPRLKHSCIDNWVVDIAKAVGRFVYLKDVVIEHMHPKYKKGDWDDTYEANTKELKAKDGQFYKHEGRLELKQAIERVSEALNAEMVHRV